MDGSSVWPKVRAHPQSCQSIFVPEVRFSTHGNILRKPFERSHWTCRQVSVISMWPPATYCVSPAIFTTSLQHNLLKIFCHVPAVTLFQLCKLPYSYRQPPCELLAISLLALCNLPVSSLQPPCLSSATYLEPPRNLSVSSLQPLC